MLIPYRVKNPVKRFPIITLSLIVANVIVYALTTEYFMVIRREVVDQYAFEFGISPSITIFTSMFLHGYIFHLLGNMLFLWVFGPSVEDRLNRYRFLPVYIVTGVVGSLLQSFVSLLLVGETRPSIGASGCIMGIVGAYWYLFSWSTVCVLYWVFWFFRGIWEVQAIWIIGIYVLLDMAEGVLYGITGVSGGVANFAHLGGAFAGALICLALKIKRDTEAVSEAKAFQSDARDLYNIPLHALETMVEEERGNPDLIRAMIMPALRMGRQSVLDTAMSQAGPNLISKDADLVAHYLVDLHGNSSIYQPVHLLRLAGMMERSNEPVRAVNIYRMVSENYPTSPDAEVALYRMALCAWNAFKDASTARTYLDELKRRFPHGEMIPFAQSLSQRIR